MEKKDSMICSFEKNGGVECNCKCNSPKEALKAAEKKKADDVAK